MVFHCQQVDRIPLLYFFIAHSFGGFVKVRHKIPVHLVTSVRCAFPDTVREAVERSGGPHSTRKDD